MQLTKTKEKEILKVYDTWMHSYLHGDVEAYDSFLDDEYHFIGSAKNEEFLNRKDTTQFFEDTGDQFAGKTEIRDETKTIELFGELIFITHIFDGWFLNKNDWTYYARFRFTSVLKNTQDGWRFIYQHFSIPDSKTEEGETIGYDKINDENQELREAITRRTFELEAKNRELEIEGAIERIRAQAVAMKTSSDLLDIVVTMRNEFIKLGHEAHYFWHMMWLANTYEKAMTSGDGSRIGFVMTLPRHIHGNIPLLANWEKSTDATVVYAMSTDDAIDYVDKMVGLGDFQNIDPQAPSHDDIRLIGGLTFIMARTTHGEIGYSLPGIVKNPPKEDLQILERFANAFDLAHRRFLDLQKAEKQAREVEIELALEKVRSRTMAMQHSDELQEASFLLDQQVRSLGIKTWGCAFHIYGEKDATEWFGNEAGILPTYTVPRKGIFKEYYNKGQKGESLYIKEFSGKACVDHYEYMSTLPVIGDVLRKLKETNNGFPTYQIDHVVFFKYGYLLFITKEHVPDAHDVFKRFANVFEQTYTRFLDLQKAEEQAREAQIELGLERVRARAMAMQSTNELSDLVGNLLHELTKLDFSLTFCIINIVNESDNSNTVWAANPKEGKAPESYDMRFEDYPFHHAMMREWKAQTPKFIYVMAGEEKAIYDDYLFTDTEFRRFPKEVQTANRALDKYVASFVFSKFGGLQTVGDQPLSDENLDILYRFGKVFDLTYTRFNDLQNAEAQAREAQIEAALERVRAQSMAMHNSDELKDVIRVIFDQMGQININAEHAGIVVDYEPKKDWHFWVAETQDIPAKITIPYNDLIWDRQFTEAKQTGKPLFTTLLNFEEKNAFYKQLLPHIEGLTKEMQDHYFECEGLAISTAIQKDIALYIENFSGIPYTEEENAVLLRFAKVFQQTYTRFLDLQKAEAQAREAQIVASLERVRAATMAMHQSKELSNVLSTLFGQYDILGINPSHAVLTLINKEKNTLTFRTTGKNGYQVYAEQEVDLNLYDSWIDTTEKWKKSNPNAVNVNEYPPEILPDVWEVYKDVVNAIPKKARPEIKDFPEGLFITEGYCQFGYIGFAHSRKPTEEEKDIVRRFAAEFGSLYQRFLDLQKAESQAREAQIEVALEKIRSRTMAMQKGEEVKDVVVLLYKELIALGVTNFTTCGYVEVNEETERQLTYVTDQGGDSLGLFYLPLEGDDVFDERYAAWKKQQTVFHQTVGGKERKKHLEYAITTFNSKEAEEMVLTQFPDPTVFYCFNFSHGYLHIVGGSRLKKDEEVLLARFTKVFEQTYARFLDLKKAEIQTREAQINLAVERVRAKALAMHKSEEIMEVVAKLKEEVMGLDIPTVLAASIFLETDDNYIRMWDLSALELSDTGYLAFTDITFKLKKVDPHLYIKRVWENPENYFVDVQNSEDLDRIIEFMYENNQLEVAKEVEDYVKSTNLQQLYHASKRLNNGKLCIDLLEPPPDEMEGILNKIGAAFDLAYQRFLDLQKAEAQTKESQIEAALEKVRSRSLAMQKPDELQEVVAIVAEKLKELGVIFDAGGVILCTYFPDNKDVVHWIAVPDFSSSGRYYVPYFDNPIFSEAWDSKIRGDAYFSEVFPVEVKNHFFEHTFKHSDYRDMPEDYKQHVLQAESHALSAAWSKNSAILIPSLTGVVPSENDAQIMQRFAKVFEQAYIRFMDLQQAEIREKEAIKQASLDRVRGEIASMRKTKDLERITPLIWKELTTLGVPFFRCGVFIIREDEKMVHAYLSKPDGTSVAALHIPFSDTDTKLIKPTIENWRLQQVYKETWNQDQFIQQTHLFMEKGQIENPEAYDISEAPPEQLVLHLIPFKQGMVYVGNHENLTEDQISLVESLSTAFSVAYSRYEDFKALETAKNSLEHTINDLKSAQAQLIQAEKMASLGELTAGIAHEIQNPLNFVNNFSEVSEELIDEMNEELDNGDLEEAKAISKDLKDNLGKINHHGKRADAIVKGMLEHSRINKGEKKPTDINALLDEFVRLSYHGLRAKDKSFNSDFKLDLEPNLPKVSVVSSDIGRVILNLVNNAFYACTERSQSTADKQILSGIKTYKPEVIVSSKKTEHGIELSVKDNGGGIPEQIKDKIFQPFFTTKPTGKGTGLGLSLSYDIIKAHRGELNLKSSEGEGTLFSIKIPIQ